ncbi:ABC transporter permease [Pseudomonas chlororaphis]|jgi:ABC-2 type transport system permease protein|uniref:ABC transporter permease n=1 Tax=Pseudomonas chlororaphis TaxID=587753 RepID=UPI0015DEF52E|nr:ABC transporter permease [Pseudomonas chlororaphis]QLL12567.1 ABC transporter permease [Pseudomonas chlororaphis subsp. aurantiaca]
MFSVLALLTRNELLGFVRSKSALFWALAFPVLLLTVMLMAFGQRASLGVVNIELVSGPSDPPESHCQAAIKQAFAAGNPVQGRFTSASVSTTVPINTVRVVGAVGAAPLSIQFDFKGPLPVRAAAHMIEMAALRCSAARQGIVAADLVRFEDMPSGAPAFDYGLFFTTGILVIVLMSMGIMSTALSIASLREHNALKVYACFPVPKLVFLASILLSRVVMMGLSASTLLLVARYGYGIQIPLWTIQTLHALPVILLGGAMLLGMGLLLASRASSVKETELLCHLVHYPALFFGNLTITLAEAPSWIRHLLSVMPINQFVDVLRQVWLDGASLPSVSLSLLSMVGWTTLFITAATLLFRWHKS